MTGTITPTQYECVRCHHKWVPRTIRRPDQCPVCQIRTWDDPNAKRRRSSKDLLAHIKKLEAYIDRLEMEIAGTSKA